MTMIEAELGSTNEGSEPFIFSVSECVYLLQKSLLEE